MTNGKHTVTISAEWFAELYRKQYERDLFCDVNARLAKECDELKAKVGELEAKEAK